MKKAFTSSVTTANYLAGAILVLVPFHAFLTVWGSALFGHYTLLRLWDEVLLLLLTGLVGAWIWRDRELRRGLAASLLVRLVLAYGALLLLLGVISYAKGDVTPKALAYGLLSDWRYLVWFIAAAVLARRSGALAVRWRRLLLVPAGLVVVFAVLQYTVLPHNFLSHFGYNAQTTIAPIETINHNSHYIRAQSTLRGANPLGAYLVLVLSGALVLFTRAKQWRWLYGVFGALALLALYATGSRSAWIGTALAATVAAWLQFKTKRSRLMLSGIAVGVVVLLGAVFLVFRNNTGLENSLFHTQKHSTVAVSSNAAHASALKSGLTDIVHQPFGDGPGTAGPASVYNGTHSSRIAENYFVQIAQEAGWLGLGLFIAIMVVVARELYRQVAVSPLALVLFASLVGLTFVNLLSHAWADDTLAYLWWGLAGVALAGPKAGPSEV